MENKEIIEGNKLIAEFMGGKYRKGNKKQSIEERYFGLIEKGYYHWVSELRYHKSWDWIMPVVEKIERLGYGMNINPHGIELVEYLSGNEKEIIAFINDDDYPKIHQIYFIIVEFIKWYNENKNNGK